MNDEFGPAVEVNGQPRAVAGDDRFWAVVAHAGVFLISFFAPLLVMLTRGKDSPRVRAQAVEALNFQITLAIAMAISAFVFVPGMKGLLRAAIVISGIVFPILAAMKVFRGESFRYPLNVRLVK